MMPLFFIIFLILAVRVAMLPGVSEGYCFMFTPRWEALKDPMIWIWAMGQAFFSLSVTGSGMIVYGAYLSKDEDVVGVAQHTALFDTIAAVVAALVIIPHASPTGWTSARARACCSLRCRPFYRISRWGGCSPSSSTLR